MPSLIDSCCEKLSASATSSLRGSAYVQNLALDSAWKTGGYRYPRLEDLPHRVLTTDEINPVV